MNSDKHKNHAFTLIELLTVIVVIAILGSVLIPVTGGVIRQSRIAASKARLWQYITAIGQFKAEYNYYPDVYTGTPSGDGQIANTANGHDFIEAISGRDGLTGDSVSVGGNYRSIQFYSFSENELQVLRNGTIRLMDPFDNIFIFIMIDVDNDGIIRPVSRDPVSPGEIRGTATAWVATSGDLPGYALWE